MRKVKTIDLKPSDQYCVWNVNLDNIVYDCVLNVGVGCQAIYIKNGAVAARAYQQRGIINEKKEKKENNSLQLIAVNYDKTFDILFGDNIAYIDEKKRNLPGAKLGVNGEVKVAMNDAWTLYKRLGNQDLTAERINDEVRRIVSQVACNIVAKYHSANTYKQLETIKGEIEKKALSEIDDTLSEYGLRTIGGLVLNIVLLEETRQMIKDADDEDKKKEQAKQKRMDEENAAYRDSALIRELMNKSGANSTNADNTVSGLVCPHCNAKLDKKVAFCPVCGQKL